MHTRAGRVVAAEMMLWLCALSIVVASAIFTKERGSLPALAQISTTENPTTLDARDDAIPLPTNIVDEEAIASAIEANLDASSTHAEHPAESRTENETEGDNAGVENDTSIRWFDGRRVRPVRTIYMTVTGYSPDARSCGKYADNKTSIMYSVWTNGMNLVAADPRVLPYRSLISVPGYANSEIVPVMDCGGAIKGNRLDLLYPTHEMALQWGVRQLPVTVWEYVDEGETEGADAEVLASN